MKFLCALAISATLLAGSTMAQDKKAAEKSPEKPTSQLVIKFPTPDAEYQLTGDGTDGRPNLTLPKGAIVRQELILPEIEEEPESLFGAYVYLFFLSFLAGYPIASLAAFHCWGDKADKNDFLQILCSKKHLYISAVMMVAFVFLQMGWYGFWPYALAAAVLWKASRPSSED